MDLYVFAIVLDRLPGPDDFELLQECGCDDAVFCLNEEQRPVAVFGRAAGTRDEAINAALRDLKAAGLPGRDVHPVASGQPPC